MDRLIIERASIRQRVKHGFILVMATSNYSEESRYGRVVSWSIYQTRKQAQEVINLVIMIAASNLVAGV